MDEGMRFRLMRKLGYKEPDDLPKHYVEVSDKACYHYRRMFSNSAPPMNDDWIVVILAELLQERDDRIAALEAKLKPASAPSVEAVDTSAPPRVEGRTREGRVPKGQLIGA